MQQAASWRVLPLVLLLASASAVCHHGATVESNTPYGFPYSKVLLQPQQKESLWLFSHCWNQNGTLSSLSITLTVLQGVLARDRPRLVSLCGDMDDNIQHFLTTLQIPFKDSLLDQPMALLTKFASSISGYILYNRHEPDSLSVALNLVSAMEQPLVVVEVFDEGQVQASTQWPRVADATNSSLMQLLLQDHPLLLNMNSSSSLWRHDMLCPEDVSDKGPALLDWIVFGRCFTWNPSKTQQSLTDYVLQQHATSHAVAMGGWDDECDLVGQMSNHSISMIVSDFALNVAALANVNTSAWQARQLRPVVSSATASNNTAPSSVRSRSISPPQPTQMHYVCAVMTDGDNLQWLLNDFDQHHTGKWFNNSARGTVTMGWTLSPALKRLAPTVLQRFYQMAGSTEDRFIAGPSGAAYEFPNNDPELQEFARRTALAMKEADLKVLNIIGSPQMQEGDVDRVASAFLQHDEIAGMFFYTWDDRYVEWGAFIKWKYGKPIVTGRVALWDETTPADIASLIRDLPTDPTRPDAYSLIPVHAWTHDVSDVAHMRDLLANQTVTFVDPETFVDLIQNSVILSEEMESAVAR